MAGPDLSPADQLDVYLARKHLGVSYQQLRCEMEAWEAALLLRHLKADLQKGGE